MLLFKRVGQIFVYSFARAIKFSYRIFAWAMYYICNSKGCLPQSKLVQNCIGLSILLEKYCEFGLNISTSKDVEILRHQVIATNDICQLFDKHKSLQFS